ncbi:MAG TPA: hypothetical protein VKF84_18175 [Candidatus Sulfotelmatobacter sp.]|nr:hypothetical protein [Candidatus Sulfotelmatobacter sp.]
MFFPGSRYQNQPQYTVTLANGVQVTAVVPPLPTTPALIGYHTRKVGERLDLLGNYYLNDATTFWRFCDANNAVVPDALATHATIGVPQKGT